MKVKTKLLLGVGLLFVLIVLLTGVSTWYINALKQDTSNILTANYNTLEYSRNMILALDELTDDPEAVNRFRLNLDKQKRNETEQGEKEATEMVEKHFAHAMQYPKDSIIKSVVRRDISKLMQLNMAAIERKNAIAGKTAHTGTLWIGVTSTLCFLIAFILLVNLPGSIANPIRELTESIRQIAAQNYHQRVHFESHSEFGELAKSFNTMAEKLEEYAGSRLSQLIMEKKRIETLINNMHDPVIGIDENGKILFANSETLKITGLKKAEIIGGNIHEIARTNDLVRILVSDLGSTQPHNNQEPLKIYADNKESYFEKETVGISITPTGETRKKNIGHVILLKNITPFKELDFAKTNFIATVSHELKTPISSIQMSVQVLKHAATGNLNEEQLQLLDSINEDSQRLLKITGELLNMTQVETGKIQLNMQPCSPHSILEYAVNAARTQADQKRIDILVKAGGDFPSIRVDSEKTAWVLTNFIINAVRYSPENSKVILSLNKSDNKLCFLVQDFGRGIEAQYRDKIFDRYFQVPGSSKSGSGLGLAISRDFIEAQGGNIGVETNPGLGSTFFFCFPYA